MKFYCRRVFAMITAISCTTVLFTGCGQASKEYSEAVELIESGKCEEAISHLETAIEENNEKAEYYIAYGMALNGTGRYKDAVNQFKKAYQDTDNKISRQNNKKLYFGQAVSYYGMNDYSKVIENCDKALEIDQYEEMNEKIGSMKAAVCELIGDDEQALKTYDKMLKDDGQAEVYLARAQLYEKLGDIKKATADYDSAIKADKKCYDAYFALYNIYKNDTNNSKLADSIISQVTDAKMESAEELMQLGRAYYYIGDYSAAVSNLEKSIKDGCNEAIYYIGIVKMAEKDYKTAASRFDEYITKTGENNIKGANLAQAYNQIAGCYILLGDYQNAQNYIDKGIALGTSSGSRMLSKNRVILYEKMGQYKKAKRAAKQYLNKFPDDKDMEKELAFINTRIQ